MMRGGNRGPHGGHHSHGPGNRLRQYSVFLGLALLFALLPTILVMHSGVEQCRIILARQGSDRRGFSGNPFSHYNLCKIRLRLSGLTLEARADSVRTQLQDVEAGGATSSSSNSSSSGSSGSSSGSSSGVGGTAATASRSPAPSAAVTGTEQALGGQGQGAGATQAKAEQSPPPPSPPPPTTSPPPPSPPPPSPSPPPPSPPPPSPPPPSPPPPSPQPPPAAVAATAKPEQAAEAKPAAGSRWHEYDVSKLISTEISQTATDMHGGGVEDWSDFRLPQTEDDIKRLQGLPHVDECFYCKVCVPNSAMRLGGKPEGSRRAKQQHRRRRGLLSQEEQDSEAYKANPAEAEELIFGLNPLEGPFPAAGLRSEGTGGCDGSSSCSSRGGGSAGRGGDSSLYRSTLQQSGLDPEGVEAEEGEEELAGVGAGGGTARRRLMKEEEKYQALDTTESGPDYHIGGRVYNISDIAPGRRIFQSKQHLPNCTACRGCDHTLEMMASGSILLGSYYAHEPGGSPSWLFRVRTDRTESGWAVVKVWCVPVLKPKQRGLGMCDPKKVYAQVKVLLAQQKLTAECGMNEIVPKVWVEPLNGVMPGSGFHVKWLGLWADIADGVSVQNLQEAGKPPLSPEVLIEVLAKRVNHHELVQGAIFDLLFSQCDRHQQNIFLTETGKFWLIDNDQVYATAWRRCGIDSLLAPTTQKFMINHLGFFYVLKYPQKNPPRGPAKFLSPLLLMDYRCHVPGGAIGKQFTPELQECLSHISSLTSETILERYGYPVIRMADAVRNRSRDLLAHGYEWSLLYSQPTNQAMHRYKIAPKCCDMVYNRSINNYMCTTPGFKQMTELPFGNAWHGGAWHGSAGLDTGSHVGGTSFLPEV